MKRLSSAGSPLGGAVLARGPKRVSSVVVRPVPCGVTSSSGMGKHRTSSDKPGDFDIYVLAQTWAPQFCCTKSDRCTTVSWAYSASSP